MISWMQKHNKYLVITIWVATIAFIGAGFVGWGTYQFGSKASTIAQVGDIKISKEKYSFTYDNLYRQYANMLQGKFDEEKAKKMGLTKVAYRQLLMQALLLNLANKFGVTVSEKELADYIASMPAFQDKGVFNKKIYITYLDSRGLKAKSFELILKDDLIVSKMMKMLNKNAEPFELEVVMSALNLKEKIKYEVLTGNDINITADEESLRKYWEKNKSSYLTERKYKLSLLWTSTDKIELKSDEVKEFFSKNSYNYLDQDGKMKKYEDIRPEIERDLRIKKGKKTALLEFIAFKKGKKPASETVEMSEGDKVLPSAIWKKIVEQGKGALIKPKAVDNRYASIKVENVVEPRPMSFEEAKSVVEKEWIAMKRKEMIKEKAEKLLKDPGKLTKTSNYLKLGQTEPLEPLDRKQTEQFLQKLFTSNKKQGIIAVSGSRIVYNIVEQKRGSADGLKSKEVLKSVNSIKRSDFEQNLLKELSREYPAQIFVKGI